MEFFNALCQALDPTDERKTNLRELCEPPEDVGVLPSLLRSWKLAGGHSHLCGTGPLTWCARQSPPLLGRGPSVEGVIPIQARNPTLDRG